MLTPKTLEQILEVLRRVKIHYTAGIPLLKAYQQSIREVKDIYHIRYQTIADGCRRRLNLKDRDEFLNLVEQWLKGDSTGLENIFKTNIEKDEHFRIEQFFREDVFDSMSQQTRTMIKNIMEKSTEVFSFRINKKFAEKMKLLAKAQNKPVSLWITDTIAKAVDEEYIVYFTQIFDNMSDSEKERILNILQK
jgi:predicted HicB family RNase H-like nuclease